MELEKKRLNDFQKKIAEIELEDRVTPELVDEVRELIQETFREGFDELGSEMMAQLRATSEKVARVLDGIETEELISDVVGECYDDEINMIWYLSENHQDLEKMIALIDEIFDEENLIATLQDYSSEHEEYSFLVMKLKERLIEEINEPLEKLFDEIDCIIFPTKKRPKPEINAIDADNEIERKRRVNEIERTVRVMDALLKIGVNVFECQKFESKKRSTFAKSVMRGIVIEEYDKTLVFPVGGEGVTFVLPTASDYEKYFLQSKDDLRILDGIKWIRDNSFDRQIFNMQIAALITEGDRYGENEDQFVLPVFEDMIDENGRVSIEIPTETEETEEGDYKEVELQYVDKDSARSGIYIDGFSGPTIANQIEELGIEHYPGAVYFSAAGKGHYLYEAEKIALLTLKIDEDGFVDINGEKAVSIWNYASSENAEIDNEGMSYKWLKARLDEMGAVPVGKTVKCIVHTHHDTNQYIDNENVYWWKDVEKVLATRVDEAGIATVEGEEYVSGKKYLESLGLSYKVFWRDNKKTNEVSVCEDVVIWSGATAINPLRKKDVDNYIKANRVLFYTIDLNDEGIAEDENGTEYVSINHYVGLGEWKPITLRKWLNEIEVKPSTLFMGKTLNDRKAYLYRRDVVDQIIAVKSRKH